MAHANLKNSTRLQRLLTVLSDGQSYDTQYLARKTGSVAVHTDASELRAQGVPVSKAIYSGLSSSGRKIFKYKLDLAPCK